MPRGPLALLRVHMSESGHINMFPVCLEDTFVLLRFLTSKPVPLLFVPLLLDGYVLVAHLLHLGMLHPVLAAAGADQHRADHEVDDGGSQNDQMGDRAEDGELRETRPHTLHQLGCDGGLATEVQASAHYLGPRDDVAKDGDGQRGVVRPPERQQGGGAGIQKQEQEMEAAREPGQDTLPRAPCRNNLLRLIFIRRKLHRRVTRGFIALQ